MNRKNICTIEGWSVNWNEIGNILLCSHEYTHETLTITTVYGAVQQLIKAYSNHFPTDLSLKRIQYELFKHVIVNQECCATFCSVMQVSESINTAESVLPVSYLNYYNKYYNCIKSKIKSTYLAHNFAEAVARMCMNNQVHIKIIEYIKSDSVTFSLLPFSPDSCFNSIINNLTPDILEELINYCNSQNTDTFSDINDDKYWESQSTERIIQLNESVHKDIYDFLSNRFAKLNILNLEEICTNTDSWIESLNKALVERYGDVDLVWNRDDIHHYKLDERIQIIIKCLDTAKIYNQPYMRSKKCLPSEDMVGINYIENHKKLNMHTFLCENCFFDVNGNWYQFNSNGEESDDVYFHYKMLSRYICQNPLFVIGMKAENKSKSHVNREIKDICENLKNICRDSDSAIKNLSRYNFMFYMFGDFSSWLDYLVQQHSAPKFCILEIDDKNASGTNERTPFAMLAFYSPSLPGIFIKCFNNMCYAKILELLKELVNQHMLMLDRSNEKAAIGKKMTQAFKAVDALWLEF